MSGYAFFDVDGTLVSIKTMFSFQDFWARSGGSAQAGRSAAFDDEMRRLVGEGASRETLNRRYYAHFAGRSVADVAAAAREWAATLNAADILIPAPVERLRAHQARGEAAVFVSGSFPALLAPIADLLRVGHVLATDLVVADGLYTGMIRDPQTIGRGKAAALRGFLHRAGADPAACWAYGDDVSDAPMLEAVGHPVAVGHEGALIDIAERRGWDRISSGR